MDDKDKQDLEKILSRSRQMQAAEIKWRKKRQELEKQECQEKSKKEKEALTKSSTNKTSLKGNLL